MDRREYLSGAVAVLFAGVAGCGGADSSTQYQGGGSDPSVVDLRYRDWPSDEVARIKDEAEEVGYGELARDVESLVGEPVTATVVVGQRLSGEAYDALLLSYDGTGSQLAYGSWTGERYIRGDVVTIWAVVLGEETYESASAGQRTVPALSLVDVKMASESSSSGG